MNNKQHWTIRRKDTMEPKSHLKRTCKTCTGSGGKIGCSLPFRKTRGYKFKLWMIRERVLEQRHKSWGRVIEL